MNPLPNWGENNFPQQSKDQSNEFNTEDVLNALDEIAAKINSLLIKSISEYEKEGIKNILNKIESAKLDHKPIKNLYKGAILQYDPTGPIPFPKDGLIIGGVDLDDEPF